MPKKISALDMASQIDFNADADEVNDLFNTEEKVEIVEKKVETVTTEIVEETPHTKEKKPWSPDKSLVGDMPELQPHQVTYEKSEMIEESHELINGTDEEAVDMIANTKDDLLRSQYNIDFAKKRWGWDKLAIPEGEYKARIMTAAYDPDVNSAQSGLDEIFKEIEDMFPEFILSRIDNKPPVPDIKDIPKEQIQQPVQEQLTENIEKQENKKEVRPNIHEPSPRVEQQTKTDVESLAPIATPADTVNVVIDKSQSNDVTWTEEDIKKLQKARTVKLNIVEQDNLNFSEIEDIDSNAVNKVMSQYIRNTNDITAPLPASRYRATFRGLSYPEVLDLNNSNEINSLDSERLKWSLVFDHMYNMSIGEWQEYDYYIDDKGNEVKIEHDNLPVGVDRSDVLHHTKFDDFLMKTSFTDIEYLIWKILCATSMDKELLSVKCNQILDNGQRCGNSYDWIYSPNELLVIDDVDKQVLSEMKITTDASTEKEIMDNFMSSPVMSDSLVELPHSKFKLIFGHISGYDYLSHIYSEMKEFDESIINPDDPSTISKSLTFVMLSVVKGILLPKEGGGYYRVKGSDNITKILHQLDEVDWQVAYKLLSMMTDPYKFKYQLRGMICPKCHHKSNVTIENMTDLLFLAVQSLASVEIEITRR